jgi:hypothetical protein
MQETIGVPEHLHRAKPDLRFGKQAMRALNVSIESIGSDRKSRRVTLTSTCELYSVQHAPLSQHKQHKLVLPCRLFLTTEVIADRNLDFPRPLGITIHRNDSIISLESCESTSEVRLMWRMA